MVVSVALSSALSTPARSSDSSVQPATCLSVWSALPRCTVTTAAAPCTTSSISTATASENWSACGYGLAWSSLRRRCRRSSENPPLIRASFISPLCSELLSQGVGYTKDPSCLKLNMFFLPSSRWKLPKTICRHELRQWQVKFERLHEATPALWRFTAYLCCDAWRSCGSSAGLKELVSEQKRFVGTPAPLGGVAGRVSPLTWYIPIASALQEPPPPEGGAAAADPARCPRQCGVCRATSQLRFRR